MLGKNRPVEIENLFAAELDEEQEREGFRWRGARLGPRIGATKLGCSVYELPPGERSFPYHLHWGNEEWLLVLEGAPTLRGPDGERELRAGDIVAFPEGPDGAHGVVNRSDAPCRVAIFSTLRLPSVVEYPDSGKVGVRWNEDDGALRFRRGDAVDYWEGEE
jgi:uncharacterized cupin superfamily protein